MNLRPSENTQLYGMNFFFNEIIELYNKKKMPTKILLSGKKGLGKSTLAYHIINYILSNNEDWKYDLDKFIINKKLILKYFEVFNGEKSTKYDVINVISDFQPIGTEVKGITKNYIFLLGALGGGFMIFWLLIRQLNTYLENYKQ